MSGRLEDAIPPERRAGARRCTNPECEYGGKWLVGTMVRTRNGKLLCKGRGCHRIYSPEQVEPTRPPTESELRGRVAEQFGFLRSSVGAFLAGDRAEALRVAVAIRVLVHETSMSHPLLKQLDPDYLAMPVPDPITMMPGIREAARDGTIGALSSVPTFTGGPVRTFRVDYGSLPLQEWWSGIPVLVASDEEGPWQFTRKNLVLTLANREGGAHIDPTGVPERHAALVTDRPVRVSGAFYSDTLDQARWTVAQSGAELGAALLRRYPELSVP